MKPTQARVLLTGATGGIGRVAAAALLRAGAAVLASGRNADALAGLGRALPPGQAPRPGQLQSYAADLNRPDAVAGLAEAAARWDCNLVVHGAGTPAFGALENEDPAALDRLLHLNLLAPMMLTQALLPHLRRQPQAQVVFIGSALGRIGLPGYSAYCASKFGLRGFAESLRRELAGTRVRVQYLGPRSTRTAFNAPAVEAYNRATGTAMDPPEAVAEALLALIDSGKAERFIGYPERLAVRLNGLLGAALDGAFRRHAQVVRTLPAEADAPAAAPIQPTPVNTAS